MLCTNSIFCPVLNRHVRDAHLLDKDRFNYPEPVKNKNEEVFSAYTADKKNNIVASRKTFFPPNMQERKDFEDRLCGIIYNRCSLFIHRQSKNLLGRRVEYKQDSSAQLTIAVVKNEQNVVTTVYPLLRYISAEELSTKEKEVANQISKNEIYIATQCTKNKNIDSVATVEFIKNASRDGVFLGVSTDKNKKKSYLVDISKAFSSLFHGQIVDRGSITVETDWINKRNKSPKQ